MISNLVTVWPPWSENWIYTPSAAEVFFEYISLRVTNSTMIFISLLLPLVVSAGVLEKRQFGGLGLFSPAAKLAGVDKLEPQYRKTAQRTLTKFGRMKPLMKATIESKTPSLHFEWCHNWWRWNGWNGWDGRFYIAREYVFLEYTQRFLQWERTMYCSCRESRSQFCRWIEGRSFNWFVVWGYEQQIVMTNTLQESIFITFWLQILQRNNRHGYHDVQLQTLLAEVFPQWEALLLLGQEKITQVAWLCTLLQMVHVSLDSISTEEIASSSMHSS